MLLNELRELGKTIILGNFGSLPLFEFLNHEKCYASWEIILKTDKGINAIKDVFIFVEEDSELKIEQVDDGNKLGSEEEFEDFEVLYLFAVAKTKRPDILRLLDEFRSRAQIIRQENVKKKCVAKV